MPVASGAGNILAGLASGIERGIANFDSRRRQGIEDRRRRKLQDAAEARAAAAHQWAEGDRERRHRFENAAEARTQAATARDAFRFRNEFGGIQGGGLMPEGYESVAGDYLPTIEERRRQQSVRMAPVASGLARALGLEDPSAVVGAMQHGVDPAALVPWDRAENLRAQRNRDNLLLDHSLRERLSELDREAAMQRLRYGGFRDLAGEMYFQDDGTWNFPPGYNSVDDLEREYVTKGWLPDLVAGPSAPVAATTSAPDSTSTPPPASDSASRPPAGRRPPAGLANVLDSPYAEIGVTPEMVESQRQRTAARDSTEAHLRATADKQVDVRGWTPERTTKMAEMLADKPSREWRTILKSLRVEADIPADEIENIVLQAATIARKRQLGK